MMAKRFLSRVVLLCAAVVMSGCDDGAADPVNEPLEPPVIVEATGPQADYDKFCALCHGPMGEGYTADNANMLANQDWLAASSDVFIASAIVNGRPGTPMSAWGADWGGPLDTERVAGLTALIRRWQNPTTVAVDVSGELLAGIAGRGKPVFEAYCVGCHGAAGEGVTAVSLNNAQFHADASDGYIADAIARGRAGTSMPDYGDRLTEQTIADLVAYIRTWASDAPTPTTLSIDQDLATAAVNPTGPDPEFTISGDRFVSIHEVQSLLESGAKMMLLDARPPSDYVVEHIAGAVSVPFYDAAAAVDVLPRETWAVAYCGCPHAASSQLTDALRAEGYNRVVVLDEGFFEWRDAGYPLTVGAQP